MTQTPFAGPYGLLGPAISGAAFDGATNYLNLASVTCTDTGFLNFFFWFKSLVCVLPGPQSPTAWVSEPDTYDNFASFTFNSANYYNNLAFGMQAFTPDEDKFASCDSMTGNLDQDLDFSPMKFLTDARAHSVLCAFDMTLSTPTGALYIDRVLQPDTGYSFLPGTQTTVALNGKSFFIGWDNGGDDWPQAGFNGVMGDFWLDNATSMVTDGIISDEQIAAFLGPYNAPVSLGSTGQGPTGSTPLMFFSRQPTDDVSVWLANRGTAGSFTANGTFTPA